MVLNQVEFLLMNNPIRRLIQRYYDFSRMGLGTKHFSGKSILEIGCGSGYGTKLVLKKCQPEFIHAIDLDERMIVLARERISHPKINFQVMDASKLDFPDNTFDAIVDFGIIHHIPNWQDCISEIGRVLKPGGTIHLEELSAESFQNLPGKVWKSLLSHPYNEMFSSVQLIESLKDHSFNILKAKSFNPVGMLRHFNVTAALQNWSHR